MVLKYHVSPSAFTEDFVIRIWEAESDGPGAHVYETTLVEKNGLGVATPGAGHQVKETVTVNGLDKVVHIIRMYGVTTGTLYHDVNVEPTAELVTIFAPIRFKIGDGGTLTPAANDDTYTDPDLIGLSENDYTIHRAGYGVLFPTRHYTINPTTGSWQLVPGNASGETMNDEEEFTMLINPKVITTTVNDSVVGKSFGGFVDIVANVDYIAGHLRKLKRFQGAFAYTFPLATSIPIGYAHCFQNFAASGTGTINFSNGTLLWAGSPKTSITIPPYCEACFIWDGTNWNVQYISQSTFINGAGAPVPGATVAAGQLNIGDVAGGDPQYTITHNQAITGDYVVFTSIKSNNAALYYRDNKIGSCWYHHATDKPNKFVVSLQELSPEVQDVTLVWMIVKV